MAQQKIEGLRTEGLRTPTVFMYHSISPSRAEDPNRLRVAPHRFEQQLRSLRRLGLQGVGLSELVAASRDGAARRLVGLTFDDGYADFEEYALPLLNAYGMRCTVYVVTGRIGGTNEWDEVPRVPLMTADAIRRVQRSGHEIGSHGVTHPKLAEASLEVIRTEVQESRAHLQSLLQREVDSFAYPYGSFDSRSVDAVRDAGYANACVTDDYSLNTLHALPRSYVGPGDHPIRVLAKMTRHQVRLRSSRIGRTP